MQDIVDIWSVLDNDLRPSVRVAVTLPLEIDVEREGPLVAERQIEVRTSDGFQRLDRRIPVSGRLLREGEPVASALIRMDRASGETRMDGTFDLRGVASSTTTTFVVVDGEMLRFALDPPAGELPSGEVLTLDLADAISADAGENGNNGEESAASEE
jgi:hypothetical protein